jgi:hypothetical protein
MPFYVISHLSMIEPLILPKDKFSHEIESRRNMPLPPNTSTTLTRQVIG